MVCERKKTCFFCYFSSSSSFFLSSSSTLKKQEEGKNKKKNKKTRTTTRIDLFCTMSGFGKFSQILKSMSKEQAGAPAEVSGVEGDGMSFLIDKFSMPFFVSFALF